MDEIMVEARDLSMRFNLGIERGFSLKQWFVDAGRGNAATSGRCAASRWPSAAARSSASSVRTARGNPRF